MAQVNRPQTQNGNQSLFTLGGALIGGFVGGPAGAVTGAGLGQTAGGMLSPQQPQQQPLQAQGESGAMARRQQQMSQDNLAVLQQAEKNLPQLPEDLRQQYAPAIVQARILEQQKRQQGMA